VIFKSDSELSDVDLAKKIEQAVYKKYDFSVPVIIRSVKELQSVITSNPFIKEKNINLEKLHVTFLSEQPNKANVETIKKSTFPNDRFMIIGKEAYLYIPESYGETKLSNKFFENKLKVTATTRNWKTVNRLLELAQA
jgi:uncharacterized protein (DUF1697 family)